MGRIERMDESLANKIAAGEVVERPASIVKELVENALDADATSIIIEVEEGGLDKIKITDDGHGFLPEDCLLAFERHATSKIKSEDDLFHVRTLGFRGEALPSIASVSHFDLRTGTGDGPGRHVVLEGGRITLDEPTHSRKGTEMTITHLFYNTPARLKYLKTIHTELANVTDVVNKLALAHPERRFSLIHNGKSLVKTNGNGDIAQVLAAIYGMETAKQTLSVQATSLDFEIKGRLVKPMISRAGRQYVYLFINGRYIRHFGLFNAVMNGYHTLLPIGRYPIAAIHITMDPTLVDVNVHPAKLEARISKESELVDLIQKAIKDVFHGERLIPDVQKPRREREWTEQQALDFRSVTPSTSYQEKVKETERSFSSQGRDEGNNAALPTEENDGRSLTKREDLGAGEPPLDRPQISSPSNGEHYEGEAVSRAQGFQNEQADNNSETQEAGRLADSFSVTKSDNSSNADEVLTDLFLNAHNGQDAMSVAGGSQTPSSDSSAQRMPKLYPIGQLHGTYILAQNEEGLFIIDQHAAQERIKYEFFREKVGETGHTNQELLFPLTFDFTASEASIIEENLQILSDLGLNFEAFGHHSFIVRSHPNWFPKGRERETIESIVEELIESQRVSIKKLREALAIMMSCKQSIKSNRYLRRDEMEALLDQLIEAEDPFTCPHGRPVIVHFSTYEMEKLFKRVM